MLVNDFLVIVRFLKYENTENDCILKQIKLATVPELQYLLKSKICLNWNKVFEFRFCK